MKSLAASHGDRCCCLASLTTTTTILLHLMPLLLLLVFLRPRSPRGLAVRLLLMKIMLLLLLVVVVSVPSSVIPLLDDIDGEGHGGRERLPSTHGTNMV